MDKTNAALVGIILVFVAFLIGIVSFRIPNPASAPGSGAPLPTGTVFAGTPLPTRGPPPPTGSPAPDYTPVTTRGTPPPVEHYPRGLPAIQPRTSGTNPSVPNFTAQDAIDFATAHPMIYQQITDPARVVESIAFLTAGEVNKQLNANVSAAPDDTLVCLVKLHGTFTKQNPFGGPPISSTNGYEVFDAHTGNLVANIILPK